MKIFFHLYVRHTGEMLRTSCLVLDEGLAARSKDHDCYEQLVAQLIRISVNTAIDLTVKPIIL